MARVHGLGWVGGKQERDRKRKRDGEGEVEDEADGNGTRYCLLPPRLPESRPGHYARRRENERGSEQGVCLSIAVISRRQTKYDKQERKEQRFASKFWVVFFFFPAAVAATAMALDD